MNWMAQLSKPSRVASILDWNKTTANTVLALNFHRNRAGIAVASHPSRGVPCLELEPLRFGGGETETTDPRDCRGGIAGAIDGACLERLSRIIEEHRVCGVVVHWPLQRDTGRMGAACGRVVFALERLWARSNDASRDPTGDVGLLSRPFCLWDAGRIHRADPSARIDAFGRCASYGKEGQPPVFETPRPLSSKTNGGATITDTTREKTGTGTNKTADRCFHNHNNGHNHNYFAGREQYYEDEQTVVLGVWEDFCREHWPDLWPPTETSTAASMAAEAAAAATTWNGSNKLPRAIATNVQKNDSNNKKKKSLVTMR